MKKARLFIFCLLILFLIVTVSAHVPKIVYDLDPTKDNPYIIEQPEISKAFYGTLNGNAEYFLVKSDEPFVFFVNILSPKLSLNKEKFSVDVYKNGVLFLSLKGDRNKTP